MIKTLTEVLPVVAVLILMLFWGLDAGVAAPADQSAGGYGPAQTVVRSLR